MRFLISELDSRAQELARKYDMGVETIAFCTAENMEREMLVAYKKQQLEAFECKALHAPYYELTPCAIDPMIGQVSLKRYRQALDLCIDMGIKRMVVHSGFQPQTYYPQWFSPRSADFWRSFLENMPQDMELVLENVFDPCPDYLIEIVDKVNDPRLGICFDSGHAQVYSGVLPIEWVKQLGSRIRHVHLHNNNGAADEHAPLGMGVINIQQLIEAVRRYAPQADICIESVEADECLRFLNERGYLRAGR